MPGRFRLDLRKQSMVKHCSRLLREVVSAPGLSLVEAIGQCPHYKSGHLLMTSYQILMECFHLDLFSPSTKRSDSCIGLFASNKTFLYKGGVYVARLGQDSNFLRTQTLWRVLLTMGELALWESAVRVLPHCYSKSKAENIFLRL